MTKLKDIGDTTSEVMKSKLPNVEAPKRAEFTVPAEHNGTMPAAPSAAMASAAPSRASRRALIALSIAIGTSVGSVVGALGAANLRPMIEMADAAFGMVNESPVLRSVVTQLETNFAAFKAGIEAGIKSTHEQFATTEARPDRAPAQTAVMDIRDIQSAAVFAQDIEAVGQPENRRGAADGREITGSVPSRQAAIAPPPTARSTVAKTSGRPQRPVVDGWIVRNVYSSTVLIEGRGFGMIEVAPGETIPGLGRIQAIRKQNGRWVVVTPRGLIVSAR